MDEYMIFFRIIHIGAAILWAGAAAFYAWFVGPTLEAFGPEGGRFFTILVRNKKAVVFFLIVSSLTGVAGGFLYWRNSGGLDPGWFQTPMGAGFTVGAVAGLISWLLVLGVIAPTAYRLTSLSESVAAAGGPNQEQMGALQGLRSRLKGFSLVNLVALGVATISMSASRYLF